MPGISFSWYGPTLHIWRATVIPLIFTGCASVSFHPAPVAPTKQPIPYSAQVRLVEHGVYAGAGRDDANRPAASELCHSHQFGP